MRGRTAVESRYDMRNKKITQNIGYTNVSWEQM
jgi:hypothetical protein